MIDTHHDTGVDHIRAVSRSRRTHRPGDGSSCARVLAVEHGRLLRTFEWACALWSGTVRSALVEIPYTHSESHVG
jgi:hypothetical protein